MTKSAAHPGFAGAVKQVEKGGASKATAEKEIGYAKAHASMTAKKKNPNLRNLPNGGRAPLKKTPGVKKKAFRPSPISSAMGSDHDTDDGY